MIEIKTTIDDVTREETSESVEGAFPYRTERCVMSMTAERLCPWHWHGEVELFYIESGSLRYFLPGQTRDFRPGDVGFVNANVLHMTECLSEAPCLQLEHIFLPRLVAGSQGSAIERRYVQPLVQNGRAELIFIPADDPGAAALRASMDRAFEAFQSQAEGFEIAVRAEMSALWLAFLRRMPAAATRRGGADGARVKAMLTFIDAHYAEPLTLKDIAAAASVGPREGSRCFQRQLGVAPFEYLLNLRIDRAGELLRDTDRSVTDIALSCGFASASYFGQRFKEKLGATPLTYRRRCFEAK